MKNDRWSDSKELKRVLKNIKDPSTGAGAPLYIDERGDIFTDDGESHMADIGMTGMGKSQCITLPYIRNVINKHESFILMDPKGEVWRVNGCYITEDYQKFVIDFRNPGKSMNCWNPFKIIRDLWKLMDPDARDKASELLSDFWEGVYPESPLADPFWPETAQEFAAGLTYLLLEKAQENEINLESVIRIMFNADARGFAKTPLARMYEELPEESMAKRYLSTYITTANETRSTILSVASNGLKAFDRCQGVMRMLANDDIDLLNLDTDRPFAIVIITPDETEVYDKMAGLLIGQITKHLLQVAYDRGGKLPIRVNVVIEELGSVGKAIPGLPNLMVAGRSRNIRVMLVLQSVTQLIDIYGKSKAATINSCIGITIGFSTNDWNTLNEWSLRCGEREVEYKGHLRIERLITPSQLAAMPVATALVMLRDKYKFISHFSLYDDMYDNSSWIMPPALKYVDRQIETFDLKKAIVIETENKISENRKLFTDNKGEKQGGLPKFIVRIYKIREKREVAGVIRDHIEMGLKEMAEGLDNLPFDIEFNVRSSARQFLDDLVKIGAVARLLSGGDI